MDTDNNNTDLDETLLTQLRSSRAGVNGFIQRIGDWVYEHKIVPIVFTVAFLLIGILFNRYVSWGAGMVIMAIGYYISRLDDDYDVMLFYICGLVLFVVPYLW